MSGATLYEVPGDHPVTYEDDVRQSDGQRPRDRVAVRNDPDAVNGWRLDNETTQERTRGVSEQTTSPH